MSRQNVDLEALPDFKDAAQDLLQLLLQCHAKLPVHLAASGGGPEGRFSDGEPYV
jgi:hypothetical protein